MGAAKAHHWAEAMRSDDALVVVMQSDSQNLAEAVQTGHIPRAK